MSTGRPLSPRRHRVRGAQSCSAPCPGASSLAPQNSSGRTQRSPKTMPTPTEDRTTAHAGSRRESPPGTRLPSSPAGRRPARPHRGGSIPACLWPGSPGWGSPDPGDLGSTQIAQPRQRGLPWWHQGLSTLRPQPAPAPGPPAPPEPAPAGPQAPGPLGFASVSARLAEPTCSRSAHPAAWAGRPPPYG